MEKSILEMVGGEKHLHYDVDNKAAKEYTTLQERIEQLEEENAELKRLKRECETSLCRAEYQYNYEQLTKAKELLRELYSIVKVECSPFAREEHKNILTEIKEFLKEE